MSLLDVHTSLPGTGRFVIEGRNSGLTTAPNIFERRGAAIVLTGNEEPSETPGGSADLGEVDRRTATVESCLGAVLGVPYGYTIGT